MPINFTSPYFILGLITTAILWVMTGAGLLKLDPDNPDGKFPLLILITVVTLAAWPVVWATIGSYLLGEYLKRRYGK